MILGASATALGQMLVAYRYELNLVGAAVVIGFGLLTLGLLRPGWLQRELRPAAEIAGGRAGWRLPSRNGICLRLKSLHRSHSRRHPHDRRGIRNGGQGRGAVGDLFARTWRPIRGRGGIHRCPFGDFKSLGRVGRGLRLMAGGVMILMGGAMLTGQLSIFSYWLLDTFPVLARIG